MFGFFKSKQNPVCTISEEDQKLIRGFCLYLKNGDVLINDDLDRIGKIIGKKYPNTEINLHRMKETSHAPKKEVVTSIITECNIFANNNGFSLDVDHGFSGAIKNKQTN